MWNRIAWLSAAALLVGIGASALPVRAHFILQEPACYSEQDDLGRPLKSAPCGQADSTAVVETGAVTTYVEGQTITITLDEVVPHPGHYRVAIAQDMASLPDDPPVTPGTTPCGSAPIDDSPELPVLADGMLVHTSAFGSPQSFEVTLPPGFTCDGCVLQVIQFMSNHALNDPGGCYYHHCANVNVLSADADAGVVPTDAGGSDRDASTGGTDSGTPPGRDASTVMMGDDDSGCSCRAAGSRVPVPALPLAVILGVALAWLRRRQ